MQNLFRIIAVLIMVALLLWGTWWLMWASALIFLFVFPTYYEIMAWGILYDALYGVSLEQLYGIPYMFSILSVFLFVLSVVLRKFLVSYE